MTYNVFSGSLNPAQSLNLDVLLTLKLRRFVVNAPIGFDKISTAEKHLFVSMSISCTVFLG